MQRGALCQGVRKILLFRYLELSRVFISAAVQHSQLLMLCSRARFGASFSFHFWGFVHIFKFVFCYILFSVPFSMHFQACQVKNIFFRFWVFFLLDPGFLTALTHSEACWSHEGAFLCCVVCGSGLLVGAKGTFAPLPSLSSASSSQASGSHHVGWLKGCTALPCPQDADPSTVTHNGQIQKESHVLAGTIIACCYHPCMDFLQDFPQYTLISVQNWMKFLLKL